MALRQVGRLHKPAPESHSLREAFTVWPAKRPSTAGWLPPLREICSRSPGIYQVLQAKCSLPCKQAAPTLHDENQVGTVKGRAGVCILPARRAGEEAACHAERSCQGRNTLPCAAAPGTGRHHLQREEGHKSLQKGDPPSDMVPARCPASPGSFLPSQRQVGLER